MAMPPSLPAKTAKAPCKSQQSASRANERIAESDKNMSYKKNKDIVLFKKIGHGFPMGYAGLSGFLKSGAV
jgi:hypothetical protein